MCDGNIGNCQKFEKKSENKKEIENSAKIRRKKMTLIISEKEIWKKLKGL